MKKMLLATALALLITGCAQQTFAVQNKAGLVRKGSHHPSIFFVSGDYGPETVDVCSQICGGAENVVKTEIPSKHS